MMSQCLIHNVGKLCLIWDFVRNNPNKIIVATGDTKQLKNPESLSNVFKFEEYANHCIDLIFENSIMLYECKRLKTEEDKLKLKDVKHLIFKTNTHYKEIIDKYFRWTSEIELCENNIAYTNRTCKEVSKKIREMKHIKDEFIVGEDVICRKYLKYNGKKFNVNFKFQIVNISGDDIMLQNVSTDEKLKIVRWMLRKHFIYAYCYTCHSKQGCSVDGDIVIYDWNKWYCEREWFFTAITRAKDFNKIKFFKYDDDKEDVSKQMVEAYFDNKIANYIEQDKKGNRTIDENDYVDVKCLMNMMNTHCQNCGAILTIDIEDGKIVSNITAQRLNNDQPHYKDNIVGFCKTCNCAFSNKISL